MKMSGRREVAFLISLLILLVGGEPLSLAQGTGPAWPEKWMSDSAFYRVWSREECARCYEAAVRSWLWGPVPFAVANEVFVEFTHQEAAGHIPGQSTDGG